MRNRPLTSILPLLYLLSLAAAPATHVDHPGLVKLHWQQAADASTFREMTTFDMIDLLHEMDFHHIELVPGQTLATEHKDWKISDQMPAEAVDALLAKLKAVKMDIVSFDPVDFGTNESEARLVFELGKKLKLKTFITDAPPERLEMLDKLATEYQINIALAAFTSSGRYKSADDLSKAIKGRSLRIGVSADLVAWKLAGRDPIELVPLDEHVLVVHLGNVDAGGKPVPVGEGVIDVKAHLTLLYNVQFKGICCVQDRTEDPQARLENFAKSVNAFNACVTELAKLK